MTFPEGIEKENQIKMGQAAHPRGGNYFSKNKSFKVVVSYALKTWKSHLASSNHFVQKVLYKPRCSFQSPRFKSDD